MYQTPPVPWDLVIGVRKGRWGTYWKQAKFTTTFTFDTHLIWLILPSSSSDALIPRSEVLHIGHLSSSPSSVRDCYDWACDFCFVSSDQNISTIYSLFSDQEQRFAITNHDLPYVPYLWFPCSLQVKLYEGKLMSIMTCSLVSVMLLVRILFIDTSLHKPVVMFTEFSFHLGTSEV
jgi:hypothetical protein